MSSWSNGAPYFEREFSVAVKHLKIGTFSNRYLTSPLLLSRIMVTALRSKWAVGKARRRSVLALPSRKNKARALRLHRAASGPRRRHHYMSQLPRNPGSPPGFPIAEAYEGRSLFLPHRNQ